MLSTSPDKEEAARTLGAYNFVVPQDEAQVNAVKGSFDFILDTVPAPLALGLYLSLLATNGTYIIVGAPPKPFNLSAFSLFDDRKSVVGSSTGGIAETQQMLDFAVEHNIVSHIEFLSFKDGDTAYERMLKDEAHYGMA